MQTEKKDAEHIGFGDKANELEFRVRKLELQVLSLFRKEEIHMEEHEHIKKTLKRPLSSIEFLRDVLIKSALLIVVLGLLSVVYRAFIYTI